MPADGAVVVVVVVVVVGVDVVVVVGAGGPGSDVVGVNELKLPSKPS